MTRRTTRGGRSWFRPALSTIALRWLLAVAACLAGPAPALAADTVDPKPSRVIDLEGTIGRGLAVHMHLEVRDVVRRGGSEPTVVGEDYRGHYSYDRHGGRIELRGRFNAQGMGGAADEPTVEIAEYVEGRKTGVFIGTLDERRFHGTWETFEPPRQMPFRLRIVRSRPP
ncbi:MAG: hypothetical protein IT520_16450 [Burkholderiales bacterium]|nr:hypothetical protein [Burkholderiales bacterium]